MSDSRPTVTPELPADVRGGCSSPSHCSASELAADLWWDEDYYAATEHGRVMWECVRMTSRGDSVRLARLDNKQLRGFVRYVKPETKMRLVPKTPNKESSEPGADTPNERKTR